MHRALIYIPLLMLAAGCDSAAPPCLLEGAWLAEDFAGTTDLMLEVRSCEPLAAMVTFRSGGPNAFAFASGGWMDEAGFALEFPESTRLPATKLCGVLRGEVLEAELIVQQGARFAVMLHRR